MKTILAGLLCGVVFGAGSAVNVGSLLTSTGNFTATSVNQALTGNWQRTGELRHGA